MHVLLQAEVYFDFLHAAAIDADTIREHQPEIMQLLNLSTLVPLLRKYKVLSESDLDRVADATHHGTIERTGFLLHSLYSKEQAIIDSFVRCLREDQDYPGHQKIVTLLEKGRPDEPESSPLFDILTSRMADMVKLINITYVLNLLASNNYNAISLSVFLDLANPDRTVEENLERLLYTLEKKKTKGFVNFISSLRVDHDSVPSHEKLFELLMSDGEISVA